MADKLYTKAELSKKTLGDLRELLQENELEVQTDQERPTKAEMVAALLELDVPPEEDEELEDEVELDEELEDEDEELEDELDDIKEELDEEYDKSSAEVLDAVSKRGKAKAPAKAATAAKTKRVAKEADPDSLAAKQVASLLGTEAKTLRQFLRSDASTFEAVGSGGRYEFTEADVPKIKGEFDAWKAAHASRGQKRTEGSGRKTKSTEPAEEIEEVEEIEELEELDGELDDEELELEDEE